MKTDIDEHDELPAALVEALKKADPDVPFLTSRVDREVLRMAHEQFATRRPAWRRPAWAAAAAVVLAVFIVGQSQLRHDAALDEGPRPPDISDVLKLARERAGEPGAQAEIDALAMRVVALAPAGERS